MSEKLVELLRVSEKILIFTGAGISTASGIPDFRGPQGVWKKRQPVYYQDFMASEKARIDYWEYKLEGWESFSMAKCNKTHKSIAKLEQAGKILRVVTQNIDGLHSQAGTSREKLVELHGTNAQVECQSCALRSDPKEHFAYFKETKKPPKCACGGFLKPATISFGQSLREEDIYSATEAARQTDLVIALGSTLSVYPAASIPLIAAVERNVPYVIINQGDTDHDGNASVVLRLHEDVTKVFPDAVEKALQNSC